MTLELSGKLSCFDLSGEGSSRGRSYILCDINYLTLKKYFKSEIYDVENQTGEQREPNPRRVNYLKNAIVNEQYTPDVFTASVNSKDQIIMEKGRVKVKLDENNPLPILNGGHRKSALEALSKESETTRRKVENLPIPLMLLLDPDKRKGDFIHLNSALTVNSSHLLSMKLDQNLVDPKKAAYYNKARELALYLHKCEKSPFFKMISFGGSISPLAFASLSTDRKGDLITSLYASAKILEKSHHTNDWFYEQVLYMDNFIKKNTKCAEEGNLLCINGARGCSNIFLGAVNLFSYYCYLHERTKPKAVDEKVLKTALAELSEPVAGDLSSKRRKSLMRNFAQVLFDSIADDPDSTVGCHYGIPISLLLLTSTSGFGVEGLPAIRGREKEEAEILVDEVSTLKLPQSDTEEGFD